MVLEESTGETNYSDDQLPKSLPPELRRDAQQIRADFTRFDYSRYQQPLPILGPLFGFNENRVRRMVAAEWAWARQTLERPLREEEEDALAGATCKQMRTMSYAGPLGAVAGLYRAYKTRESWRLPFWTMGKDFDPGVVKIPGGRQVLEGEAAKSFWRILRNVLYTSNGVVFMMCFFLSFSASSVSVAIARDPRLKEFAQSLSAKVQQQRQQRMQRQPGFPVPQRDPTGQGPRSAGELWRNHRQEAEGRESNFDDASPSGGVGVNDGYINYTGRNHTSYSPQDSYGSGNTASITRQSGLSQSQSDNSSGGDIMDDLDASPTAQPMGGQRGTAAQATGGAWERLRRQAAGGSSEPPRSREQRTTKQSGGGDGGFSFNSAEEEKQLAQSEAQREFDARIERERQGSDFDGGRGRRNW